MESGWIEEFGTTPAPNEQGAFLGGVWETVVILAGEREGPASECSLDLARGEVEEARRAGGVVGISAWET